MRVFLPRIGANPFVDLPVNDFERLAASDRFGEHALASDPGEADLILFTQCHMVDWRLRTIREHPLAKKHWDAVMVYDERDRPWRSFPGVYVSASARQFDDRMQRAWAYCKAPEVVTSSVNPDLLFSFVASDSHRCRKPLFRLRHPDALVEEVRDFMFWDSAAPGFADRRASYQNTLARSRFVLCPRGRGTSTFRLYEALAAGRVPVILSDDWVPPSGPDWERFCLRWPEGTVDGLVELLEERNRDWPSMSAAAVRAHNAFFTTDASFHRIVDLCRDLRESGGTPPPPSRMRHRSIAAAFLERSNRALPTLSTGGVGDGT